MDINKILEETPSLKAKIAEEAENLRSIWQKSKEQYENNEAKYMLSEKAKDHNLKATDLKILVNNNDDLYKERLKIILYESTYRKKELEITRLDDLFTAAKMKARILISEMGSLNTEIYGKDGKK